MADREIPGIRLRPAVASDAQAIGAVFDAAVRVGWTYLGELANQPMFSAAEWDKDVADHAPPNLMLVATDDGDQPTTPFASRAAGGHFSTPTSRTSACCMSTPVRATAQTDRYGSRTSAGPECESSAWSSGSGSKHEAAVALAERLGKRNPTDLARSGRPAKPAGKDREGRTRLHQDPPAGCVQAIRDDLCRKPAVGDFELDVPG